MLISIYFSSESFLHICFFLKVGRSLLMMMTVTEKMDLIWDKPVLSGPIISDPGPNLKNQNKIPIKIQVIFFVHNIIANYENNKTEAFPAGIFPKCLCVITHRPPTQIHLQRLVFVFNNKQFFISFQILFIQLQFKRANEKWDEEKK